MNDPLDRFLRQHSPAVPPAPLGHLQTFQLALKRQHKPRRASWVLGLSLAALVLLSLFLPAKDEKVPQDLSEEAFIVETLDDFDQLLSFEEPIYEPY